MIILDLVIMVVVAMVHAGGGNKRHSTIPYESSSSSK